MAKKKVGTIVVEALRDAGVRRCYGVPGDTLNHVTDAIRADGSIEWVLVRHEEAGGFAAGADALLSGRLAMCAGTCGPGSLHFVNGLFESHRNRAPVVLIATQVATTELGVDFPQELDLRSIYKGCSVFCEELRAPSEARRLTVLAAQAALTERGVAVLVLPGDLAAAEVEDSDYTVHAPASVTTPLEADIARLAAALNEGGDVALYAGAGAEHAHDQIVALAERLQAPVAHTSRAKDFLERDNPFNVGMTGLLGEAGGFHAVSACRTLLLLGTDFAWRQFYPDGARIHQIDIEPRHLGRRHAVEIGLAGDVAATLDRLLPQVEPRSGRAFLDACLHRTREAAEARRKEEAPGRGGLIHPQRLAALVGARASDDAVFTADGGSPMVWLLRHVAVHGRRRTLLSLLHGTMANAMPMALGGKKACPERQVIAFSGDGGLAMLMGDLLDAVQNDIAIKVVVFDNGSLGFVEMEMKVEGLLDAYTGLKNPDFSEIARVIGYGAWRVDAEDGLEAAVDAFLAHPGPALLHVKVNRMELVMPPKVEAAQAAHTALYGAKALLAGRAGDVAELVRTNFLNRTAPSEGDTP